MPDTDTTLSIGQVAARTGLSVHTLRFYENEGLLPAPIHRDANGRRRYSESNVAWLLFSSKLRTSGMPITAIRRYVELVREGPGNEAERLALLRGHQQNLNDRITHLNDCLNRITFKVDVYADRLAEGTADNLWAPSP